MSKAIDALWQDTRHAIRGYLRTPLFTIVTLLTLGVGIGANSAIFSLVNAVVLRPLPYQRPHELVRIYQTARLTGRQGSVSPPNYLDFKDQTRGFTALAAYWSPSVSLSGPGGDPEKVLAATCSHDLFGVLGVSPRLGRGFGVDDDVPGARRVAVLAYGLWQRRFAGDPNVVGRELILDGSPTSIVGVMPPAFDFPSAGTELWVPLRLSRTQPPNPAIRPEQYRQYRILNVVGRLRPDVSLDQSRSEMIGVARQLEQQYPDANRQLSALVVPLHETVVGPVKPALLILLSAVGCVLLIACANVGGLMLVRATARSREVSIRMALGADRMRLVRQLLTESVVLAAAGGVVGLIVGAWSLDVLVRVAPAGIPRIDQVRIDSTVVAFTFATAVVAGLIFGVAPALHVRGRNPQESLRSAGRGTIGGSHQTARHLLVVAEMALSLVLAIGAALLIQSFIRVQRVDAGFHTASIVTIDRIELPRQRASAAASAAFFDQLLTKIRAIPGVDEAGATLGLPLDPRAGFFVDDSPFAIAGQPALPRAQRPSAPLHVITAGFFSTIDVPLRRGRLFDQRDGSSAPAVIIINEAMARRFWPNQDPIGQRIAHELSIVPGQATTRAIVGVVGDVRHFGLEQTSDAQMYIPHGQMPWPSMAVVVRSALDRQQIDEPIRRAVWSMDPTIPVPPLRTMDEVLADAVGQPRFRAWLLGLFASIAVLLVSIGLYGTMAYAVQQRTREIGLRIALGATPRQAGALLLRGGIKLVFIGTALGVAVAAAVTRLLSSLLYGVVATDPATFVLFPIGLGAIGLLACYLPTLAARRIDPIHAINSDN